MSSAYVSSLAIYPLKSCAAIALENTVVLNTGLSGDRRFMLTKMDGSFITGRTHPKITSITSRYVQNTLVLSHPSCEDLTLERQSFSSQYYATQVWGSEFLGQSCGDTADQWISRLLAEPLRILFFGDKSNRPVTNHRSHSVGFADGFPILLANTESLAHLNQRLLAPVGMANFRPNIVISGVPAWAEDEWAQVRIGEVVFDLPKPCSRCVFITVDPANATLDVTMQPLKTLTLYRQEQAGKNVIFGENMLALNEGSIKIGDKVEVIKTKVKPIYADNGQSTNSRVARQLAQSNQKSDSIKGKILLRCVQIINDTSDVKTFKFIADPLHRFAYLPGQFITLHPRIESHSHNRCYTLSSSPSRPDVLSITVKRVDDGIVSNWLHDNFSIGSSIEATSAAGIFHLSETSASKILLLSAGSGITPMLSIVRYVTDLALDIDIHFHHSAKTVDDLICFDELQDLSQQQSNLTLSCNLSRQSISDALAVPHKKGRLAQEHLTGFCPDLLQREVFVCGPDAFMLHAKHLLITLGLPEAQYSQESFEIEKVDIVEDLANASFKVKFIQTGIEVDVPGDQTVLEAAENAGIYPDYSCLSGICGSCISQLISGEVEAPGAIAIDEDDPDSNDFLPCCSYPRSDLEVDL